MMNRRDFFRVVAASGATAAASGCQRATETILPLVVPNEQIVPGVAAWFATVCRECPAGCGVIARNREGRVVKLEGNPDHPVNQGALCARGQAANRITFGRDAIPYFAFEDAEVVLSFGADFLETWLSNVNYARTFARMHTVRDGRAGTFIHVEPRQSLTASNADEWVRNAPGTEGQLALAMLKVMVDERLADRRFAEAVAAIDVKKIAADSGVPVETIVHVAEVFAHGRPGLAVGGGMAVTGSNATSTQVAINLLNAAAGNVGKTVRFGPDSAFGKVTPYAEVVRLADAMAKGEIEMLLLGSGVNPAYTLPGGLRFADAVKKVGLVVSLASQPDETTALAHIVLPDTHWLESWGDYSPREGVSGLMQPTMSPVRDSRPMGDTFLAIGRAVLRSEEGKGPLPWATFERYLRATWEPLVRDGWAATLRQGGVWKEPAPVVVSTRVAPADATPPKLEGEADGLALLAYPSLRFYDGRGASRAWLQEAPDTMTQAVWVRWARVLRRPRHSRPDGRPSAARHPPGDARPGGSRARAGRGPACRARAGAAR